MSLPSYSYESSAAAAPARHFPQQEYSAQEAPVRRSRLENPVASDWSVSAFRRFMDISVALMILAIFGIPILALALCVRLSSSGPAFFIQDRVGRGGRLFRIFKLRTMASDAARRGPGLTREGDVRVTAIGRWLRRLKLDELPQFYNILRGDMSLVGPRPKLPQYVAIVNMPYRPGITGAATLAFRREEEILRAIHPSQIDNFYHQNIRPLKARIDARYMCRATLRSDLGILGATCMACLTPARTPASLLRGRTARVVSFPVHAISESEASKSLEVAN